jgi:hypothetical protein
MRPMDPLDSEATRVTRVRLDRLDLQAPFLDRPDRWDRLDLWDPRDPWDRLELRVLFVDPLGRGGRLTVSPQ